MGEKDYLGRCYFYSYKRSVLGKYINGDANFLLEENAH
jgi:hypothetical protein